MFSPVSKSFAHGANFGKVQMPTLPGLEDQQPSDHTNPFSGIRRAGQAKREQNFIKFSQKHMSPAGGEPGAQAGTLVGSMKQMKF